MTFFTNLPNVEFPRSGDHFSHLNFCLGNGPALLETLSGGAILGPASHLYFAHNLHNSLPCNSHFSVAFHSIPRPCLLHPSPLFHPSLTPASPLTLHPSFTFLHHFLTFLHRSLTFFHPSLTSPSSSFSSPAPLELSFAPPSSPLTLPVLWQTCPIFL